MRCERKRTWPCGMRRSPKSSVSMSAQSASSAWHGVEDRPVRLTPKGEPEAADEERTPPVPAVGATRSHQGTLMPFWMMRAYTVLVFVFGVGLGMATSHGQFGWWSSVLVPVALVFAGSHRASWASVRRSVSLNSGYRHWSSGSGPRTPNSSPDPCERIRRVCPQPLPTFNRAGRGRGTDGSSAPKLPNLHKYGVGLCAVCVQTRRPRQNRQRKSNWKNLLATLSLSPVALT